jgi:hypothetical protein
MLILSNLLDKVKSISTSYAIFSKNNNENFKLDKYQFSYFYNSEEQSQIIEKICINFDRIYIKIYFQNTHEDNNYRLNNYLFLELFTETVNYNVVIKECNCMCFFNNYRMINNLEDFFGMHGVKFDSRTVETELMNVYRSNLRKDFNIKRLKSCAMSEKNSSNKFRDHPDLFLDGFNQESQFETNIEFRLFNINLYGGKLDYSFKTLDNEVEKISNQISNLNVEYKSQYKEEKKILKWIGKSKFNRLNMKNGNVEDVPKIFEFFNKFNYENQNIDLPRLNNFLSMLEIGYDTLYRKSSRFINSRFKDINIKLSREYMYSYRDIGCRMTFTVGDIFEIHILNSKKNIKNIMRYENNNVFLNLIDLIITNEFYDELEKLMIYSEESK